MGVLKLGCGDGHPDPESDLGLRTRYSSGGSMWVVKLGCGGR